MTPLEDALSDAIAAKLSGHVFLPSAILRDSGLCKEIVAVLDTLGRHAPSCLIPILDAFVDNPEQTKLKSFENIAHKLSVWALREILLPKIKEGEGIGRAVKTCRYVIRHLENNDLNLRQWNNVAGVLSEINTTVKDASSAHIIRRFIAAAEGRAKSDYSFSGIFIRVLNIWFPWFPPRLADVHRQTAEKLAELIRNPHP